MYWEYNHRQRPHTSTLQQVDRSVHDQDGANEREHCYKEDRKEINK